MTIRLIFLALFLINGIVSSQIISNVDFGKTKKEIRDSLSEFYYPNLLERLRVGDTTLEYQDYFHLYYGSVFQPDYHPYGTSNAKKEFLDAFDDGKFQKAYEKGVFVLEENPVDLELLVKMSISCLEIDEDDKKRIFAIQYFSFLEVIYKSGDGKYVESAYVVVSVDHEYLIAADLGLRVVQQALIQDCDWLKFSKRGQPKIKGRKKIKHLYFNVRMPLLSLSNSFKDIDLPEPDEEDE